MSPKKKKKKPTKKGPPKPEELLTELSIKIYAPPLSDIRTSGAIADLSKPISVVMLLIDFETEVMMNGIADYLGNSTGLYVSETVEALKRVGCSKEASLLDKINKAALRVGMTRKAVLEDMRGLAEYTVASFREIHGTKWDAALDEISELCDKIDFSNVMKHADAFAQEHEDELLKLLP